MGGSVALRRREEAYVVRFDQFSHELVDELLRRETPESPIFRGDDDVEGTDRAGHDARLPEPLNLGADRVCTSADDRLGHLGGEVVATLCNQLVDVLGSSHLAIISESGCRRCCEKETP